MVWGTGEFLLHLCSLQQRTSRFYQWILVASPFLAHPSRQYTYILNHYRILARKRFAAPDPLPRDGFWLVPSQIVEGWQPTFAWYHVRDWGVDGFPFFPPVVVDLYLIGGQGSGAQKCCSLLQQQEMSFASYQRKVWGNSIFYTRAGYKTCIDSYSYFSSVLKPWQTLQHQWKWPSQVLWPSSLSFFFWELSGSQ